MIIRGRKYVYSLTPFEKRVMYWIMRDFTGNQTAIILGITQRAVEKQIERLRDQYRVGSRAALLYQVFKHRKL